MWVVPASSQTFVVTVWNVAASILDVAAFMWSGIADIQVVASVSVLLCLLSGMIHSIPDTAAAQSNYFLICSEYSFVSRN